MIFLCADDVKMPSRDIVLNHHGIQGNFPAHG